jgi:hypothetical protein
MGGIFSCQGVEGFVRNGKSNSSFVTDRQTDRKRNVVVRLHQIDGTKFRHKYVTFTIIRQDGIYLSTKKNNRIIIF